MLLIEDRFILNTLTGILEELETGTKTSLGGNEVALLQFMIENPSQPLSKAQLLDEVWFKKGVVVEESSLLHAVSTCRKALDDRSGETITTVRGIGYQFNGNVSEYVKEEHPTPNSITSDEPTRLKRNNTFYLIAFTLSAMLSYGVISLVSTPWVEADYQEQRYVGCVIELEGSDEKTVLNNVRAFKTGDQVILVSQNGESVSYVPSELEVACE